MADVAEGGGNTLPAVIPQTAKAPGLIARIAQASRYIISGVGNESAGVNPNTWMGPLQPLQPIAPPEVKGRQWDFPVGINTRYRPRSGEPIDFRRLRGLADGCDILKSVVERQKELIDAFDWQIKPREDIPGHRPPESKYKTQITAITQFLHTPDQVNDWSQWLHMLLDEVFVIDALAVYRRPTRDGTKLFALEIISGDTITPLVDGSGRRPLAPDPAYQQVLKGVVAADFSLDELIYYPKSPRAGRLYGCPPVQWIIGTVETAIERVRSQKSYFTEGNLVDALLTGPADWTIDQVKAWQLYWDDQFAGNVESRRRGQWVPNGAVVDSLKQPPLKDEFDEWLARVICYAYSTSPMPFVKSMNRGNMEGQQEVAEEGGIATYMQYVKRLLDKVIREDLQQPELEFCWSEDREFDPMVAAEIDDLKLKNGSRTMNEVRDRNGDDPYDGDWADTPMMMTATGPVPLEATVAREIDLAENPPDPTGLLGPDGLPVGAPPGPSGGPGGVAPKPKPKGSAAAPKPAEPKPAAKPVKKRAQVEVPLETRAMSAAVPKVRKAVRKVLSSTGVDVKEQIRRKLLIMGKAADKPTPAQAAAEAGTVVDSLDLSKLEPLAEDIEEALAAVAQAAGEGALVQLGVSDNSELVDQVAQRALVWSRDRAAELVGKRWTAEGLLIDNPNPKWAIDQSTRDMLRGTIAQGLEDNLDVAGIAEAIGKTYAFSEDRADLIAHTEVRRANVQGALEGAREARDSAGVMTRKVWLLGQDPCDECLANADDGPIELDADFSSGDDGPPAHPNCFCSLSWDIEDLSE